MTNENYYGFDNSNDVKLDAIGLPIGTAQYMATVEEPAEKDELITGVIVTFECLTGENKGKSGKVWYNTLHSNPTTANIAKAALKRLADATGKPITQSTPIKGRVLTLEVQEQKKNNQYSEIRRYLPAEYKAEEAPPF